MQPRDVLEIFRMAFNALSRSPARSGLTILGLAIGIAAFIAMTSFGQGARSSVVAQFAGLGTNILRVRSLVNDPAAGSRAARPLTASDVLELRRNLTTVSRVVPQSRRVAVVSHAGATISTIVHGVDPGYGPIHLWPTTVGGFFDDSDLLRRSKVCLLGVTPARALFGTRNPLGARLAIGEQLTCHVIGVLAEKGRSTNGGDLDELILIPVTTFEAYLGMPDGYQDIEIEAIDARGMPTLRAEAEAILRRTHQVPADVPLDVRMTSPTEAVKAAETVSGILTSLLAAIAAVSLLVGGIGIMNIQLVSVAERTKEIGTRAAIGAAPQQILIQFLAEALLLSLLGSLVGMAAGLGAAVAVANAMHWPRAIEPLGVIGAAAFGIGAGLLFGYMPAKRASDLDPIDALRSD
jgi:putative ABC transport system permease protein